MSVRFSTLAMACFLGTLSQPALAQGQQEQDQKATGQKSEDVRKQKEQLLPPKDALEQTDNEVAPDAYQPAGIEMGGFVLFPKMEADFIRNSNVFASAYDAVGDTITVYRPEVALKSRFERHSLSLLARGERKLYKTYAKENVTNGQANLAGRFDVNDTDTLSAGIAYTHEHEDRGSPDEAGGLRPTEFHYLTLDTSANVTTGDLTSSLGLLAVRRDWEDTLTPTGPTPSHLRNRWEYQATLRESYEFVPGYALIGEGAYIMRRYVHDFDQRGIERDSDGIRLSTGLGLSLSNVVRGDFLAGYFRQDYKDAALTDVSGPFIKALFNWTPTKLTTIIPSVERTVEETTAAGVSSLIRSAAGVTVRHEFQRNIILTSTLSYSKDEQKGGALTSNMYSGTLRGTYLLNRNVYTTLEVGQKHKIANVDGSGFNQTAGMLRFGVQY